MTQHQLSALGISLQEWNDMGPIEKLYLDVSDRLSCLSEIVWVELEAGQLEIPEESYPVQFPCVLIDFPDNQYENELEGNQQAILTIQLRLAIDLYEDLHMSDGRHTPDAGTAVKRLSLISRVHRLLHGWDTPYTTHLMRVGITAERRDDGLKVFSLLYACAAKDDTAATVQLQKDVSYTVSRHLSE